MSTKKEHLSLLYKCHKMDKNIKLIFTLFMLSILVFQACQKDNERAIEEELMPYFNKFKDEAALRGIVVDYDAEGITASITKIYDNSIVGQCIHNTETPNRISISETYWNQIDTGRREFLIFHELGHCILDRSHLDSKDVNGNCVSIMHSSEGVCTFKYDGTTRSEYLDELFNQ